MYIDLFLKNIKIFINNIYNSTIHSFHSFLGIRK